MLSKLDRIRLALDPPDRTVDRTVPGPAEQPDDPVLVPYAEAVARCAAGWSDRTAGLVRRRTGHPVADLSEVTAAIAELVLDPVERGALERVVRAIELRDAIPPSGMTFIERTLAPVGGFVGACPHPDVLHALAAAWLDDADATQIDDPGTWWGLAVGALPTGADDLRAARAAALRDWLVEPGGVAGLDVAADRMRWLLFAEGFHGLPAHMVVAPDAELCSMFVQGTNRRAPGALDTSTWIRRFAADPGGGLRWLDEARALGLVADGGGHVPAAQRSEVGRLDRAAARRRLLADVAPVAASELAHRLVDAPASQGGALPVGPTLRLAATPGIHDAIDALVHGDLDYGDFDAPGEGALPAWWSVVALLAGDTVDAARSRVAAADPDVDPMDELVALAGDDDGGHALGGASPTEADAHGLRDGVIDAYGGTTGASES